MPDPASTHRHYVLWLVNAVQPWPKGELLAALTSASTDARPITAELGDREEPSGALHGIGVNDHEAARKRPAPYRGITEYTPYGALMHEGGHLDALRLSEGGASKTFDEYFVPIPVKCIGDPQQVLANARTFAAKHGRGPVDDAALHEICQTYAEYFAEGAPLRFERYWDEGLGHAPTGGEVGNEVRMHSRRYVGFYEMLLRWNAREGHANDRHVLLGYSQGGLVARFLAHLDERVFGLGLLHGVVTVQAPNFGSPVANPENAPALEALLATVLRALPPRWLVLPFVPSDFRELARFLYEAKARGGVRIADLDNALGRQIAAIHQSIAKHTASSVAASRANIAMLVSGRKWLSGLVEERRGTKFAFIDLNPERIGEHGGRVLELLHRHDHGMAHGAVVGCNPSLEALFGSGVLGVLGRFLASAAGLSLSTLTQGYQNVHDEGARSTAKAPPRPIDLLRESYQKPIALAQPKATTIPKLAHDCVIPSAHQLIHAPWQKTTPKHFLGNLANLDANHASGTARSDRKPTSMDLALELLRAIPAHDP